MDASKGKYMMIISKDKYVGLAFGISW